MKKALPLVLLAGAALLFCLGAGALTLNFALARPPAVDLTQWRTPIQLVETKKINPVTAMRLLAGATDSASIDDALAAGDWETALAVVAYSGDLSDADRMGTLLLLGSRYAAGGQLDKAAWCYEYTRFLSLVSPLPSDLMRTQSLLEVAQGLRAIRLDQPAREALDQAYLIAEYSYALPRDTRARLLEQVARAYQSFGVSHLTLQARQKSAESARLTVETAINIARRPFRIPPTALPENPELVAKLKERVDAARILYDDLNLNPPQSPDDLPEDLMRELGDRLYEEDALRLQYYDDQYSAAADASSQLGALRDKLRWLAIKYRIAKGGFGLSLVAEWEDAVDQIAQDVNDTYAEFFQITEQQASSVEKVEDADRSIEDVIRSSLVAGRWGFYPDYDETDLRSRLDEVSQHLRDDQVPSLRLDTWQRGSNVHYLLLPDELYGLGERALPR